MRQQLEPSAEPFIGDVTSENGDGPAPAAGHSVPQRFRSKALIGALAGVAVLAALGGVAYKLWRQHAAAPERTVATPASEAAPARAEPARPTVRYPMPPPSAAESLPSLADSDDALRNVLGEWFSRDVLGRYFHLDGIVRRVVATVDNLPRQIVAPRIMPLRPVPGAFAVAPQDGRLVPAADNDARYAPYVQLLERLDTRALVGAYQRLYPLFQQAYAELGYPNSQFNDRLVDVIDVMLATPEPSGPIALTQPKVVYQFADPQMEALPAGQKLLLRIGPSNAAKVKAKLSEIRAQIAGGRPAN
jgi:hypothetical protein